MEVKIGIQSVPRELVVETETPRGEIESALATALSGDRSIFALASEKGGKILVPADKIAYVEFGEVLAPGGRPPGIPPQTPRRFAPREPFGRCWPRGVDPPGSPRRPHEGSRRVSRSG